MGRVGFRSLGVARLRFGLVILSVGLLRTTPDAKGDSKREQHNDR